MCIYCLLTINNYFSSEWTFSSFYNKPFITVMLEVLSCVINIRSITKCMCWFCVICRGQKENTIHFFSIRHMPKICQGKGNIQLILIVLVVDCRTLDSEARICNTQNDEQYAQLHLIYIIYIKSTNLLRPLYWLRTPRAKLGEILYPLNIPSFSILTLSMVI